MQSLILSPKRKGLWGSGVRGESARFGKSLRLWGVEGPRGLGVLAGVWGLGSHAGQLK